MKVNCVIIDDEPLALKLMVGFAGKVPFLTIKESFTNPVEAKAYIESEDVDLLFLDINMPGLNGIEFLKSIRKNTMTVFCTAYPDFALEGYELQIIDYLMKPFSFDRFLKAACKGQELLMLKNAYNKDQKPATEDQAAFIFVKSEYALVKVNISEIVLLEGLKDYIKIHLKDVSKPILTLQSLRALEEKLPSSGFCRVHKSFIINLNHLQSVQRNHLHISRREIPIGNQYKNAFLSIIGNNTPR